MLYRCLLVLISLISKLIVTFKDGSSIGYLYRLAFVKDCVILRNNYLAIKTNKSQLLQRGRRDKNNF